MNMCPVDRLRQVFFCDHCVYWSNCGITTYYFLKPVLALLYNGMHLKFELAKSKGDKCF